VQNTLHNSKTKEGVTLFAPKKNTAFRRDQIRKAVLH